MGRCGHVAFCSILLFYCSIITASSPHLSVKRKDGVPEVNMTSVLQTTEMDLSNQTQPSVNSTEPTPHADNRTAGMVVNSTTPMEDNSFSENITDSRNMSDVSHVQNQTATSTTIIRTTLLPSTTHTSATSFHTTITASRRTTHSSSPEIRGDPSSTATQSTQTSTSSSSSSSSSNPIQAGAHMNTPSALNVVDGDSNKVSTDPLLAGLVSAFVVVAAIVSVLVFLKFRNTNSGPRFRRLQDLPMDDMLEDAPLSMYSY